VLGLESAEASDDSAEAPAAETAGQPVAEEASA
jgi:hypothetical protein